MKKVLAAVLVLCVIFGVGAAFAQQRGDFNKSLDGLKNVNFQRNNHQEMNRHGMHKPMFPGFTEKKSRFTPDMPKEIRLKVAEVAKLRIDLDEVLTDKELDKEKALEIHKKIQKLEQEIDDWKFEKRLKRIQAMKRHHEIKRKDLPAPKFEPEKEKETKPEQTKQ